MRHRGPISPKKARLSEDALAALESGDVNRLMEVNRARYGGMVMMADADDDDDDDDEDDDGDSGADDDTGKKKKSSKDDSDSGADDEDDEDAEKENLRRRMKAADKRATEAERELQKIKDKDKSELERAQSTLTDLEKQVAELQSENRHLNLQNAFLTANTHKWHDPDTALSLAESKKYLDDVMDDDGVVDKKAMKKALERMAAEHKYLVNTDTGKKDDEPGGPSGEPSSRRSDNGKDEKAKDAALKKRFPVLNR